MANEVEITVLDNGPLLIKGDMRVQTADGKDIPVEGGPIALCRCGGSKKKPFCDGAHKAAGFQSTAQEMTSA